MPLFLTSDVLVEILSESDLRVLPATDPGNGYPYLATDGTLRVDSGAPLLPGPTVEAGKFWMTDGLGGTVYGEPELLTAEAIEAALGYLAADDAEVVHLAGTETITGDKRFNAQIGLNGYAKLGGVSAGIAGLYAADGVTLALLKTDSVEFGPNFANGSSRIYGSGGYARMEVYQASGAVWHNVVRGNYSGTVSIGSATNAVATLLAGPTVYIGSGAASDTALIRESAGLLRIGGDAGLRVRNLLNTGDAAITAGAATFSGQIGINGHANLGGVSAGIAGLYANDGTTLGTLQAATINNPGAVLTHGNATYGNVLLGKTWIGSTSTFGGLMLKWTGSGLAIRLADDSNYNGILASNGLFSGIVSVTGTFSNTGGFASDAKPSVDNTYDAGTALLRWKDGYFAGTVNAGVVSASTINGVALTTGGSASAYLNGAGSYTTVAPAVGDITGLGTGVAAFLATPSSANLATAVTDETGSGALVFADTPTLVTPTLSGNTQLTGYLQFGGVTASYPMFRRFGTRIDVKLADNSAYAALWVGSLVSYGAINVQSIQPTADVTYDIGSVALRYKDVYADRFVATTEVAVGAAFSVVDFGGDALVSAPGDLLIQTTAVDLLGSPIAAGAITGSSLALTGDFTFSSLGGRLRRLAGSTYLDAGDTAGGYSNIIRGTTAGATVIGVATVGHTVTISPPTLITNLIQPAADNTHDLGTSVLRWKDSYFAGRVYAGVYSTQGAFLTLETGSTGSVLVYRAGLNPSITLLDSAVATALTLTGNTTNGLVQSGTGKPLLLNQTAGTNVTVGGVVADADTKFSVISDSTSTVIAKFKAIASQSANLTEWQNSAGTVLASISAAGAATFAGNITGPLGLIVAGGSNSSLTLSNSITLAANTGLNTVRVHADVGLVVRNQANSAYAGLYAAAGTFSDVVSALTYNKVTVTAPATGSTLTIADGKTLTVSNTLTFTGTDSSTVNVGAGGTLGAVAYAGLGSPLQILRTNAGATGVEWAAAGSGSVAVGDITGFGTGVATALGINVGSAGAFVTLDGALGTPASGVATNLTGTAAGLTAGTVTTNANLTGHVTSSGNSAVLGSFTKAQLDTAISDGNALYVGDIVGNVTHTGDATGDTALTLATVNSNVGSFGSVTQAVILTVNAKGLVTAASASTITPAVGSVTGFGTGVATALGINVGSAGAFVVLGGALGTPSSGVATNLTGTASGLTAGNVTTNANLTGHITSTGNAAVLGSFTKAQLDTAVSDGNVLYVGDVTTNATHTGDATGATALTLATVNSNVGSFGSTTQASVFTVNAKGLITAASNSTITPAIGSVTGLGTSVATALGINVGSAGAFVVLGGALGTPSSGVATNLTGTASGLTAGNVTTNANLTGHITSTGNSTVLGSFTKAQLDTAISDGNVLYAGTASTGWAAANYTPTKTIDPTTSTMTDLINLVATLTQRLIDLGIISA